MFGGFTATAGCYCYLLPATCAPNAAADNRMPYLLLLLVNRTSNKSTCRQQNTLPLKDELAPESPPKAPADSKTPCHYWLLLPLATCYCAPAADNKLPYLLLLLVDRTSNKSTCQQLAALLLLLVSEIIRNNKLPGGRLYFSCCCCCCAGCGSSPKQESKVLFPGALPLASAGVGGYIIYPMFVALFPCFT